MERQTFNSDISHNNLHQNYLAARREVSQSSFSEDDVYFLLNDCQLVCFVLKDVSEAFQFLIHKMRAGVTLILMTCSKPSICGNFLKQKLT